MDFNSVNKSILQGPSGSNVTALNTPTMFSSKVGGQRKSKQSKNKRGGKKNKSRKGGRKSRKNRK